MSSQPSVLPTPIFETLHAYHASGALHGAIELDLFSRIAAGKHTAAELAADAHADERGMRILCDALAALGFLRREGPSHHLVPLSQTYLDRKSPLYIGSINTILTHPLMWEAYNNVAGAVRKGGTLLDKNALTPDHPFWVEFATALAPAAKLTAQQVAEILETEQKAGQAGQAGQANMGQRILDIACGSGYYGFAIAQRDPSARVTSVDWPTVLERTRAFAKEAGVSDRVNYLPGDLFKVDYGTGYDIALLTNIYHHFDRETCLALSRKVYNALKPGGRVAILEFVPKDDRSGPLEAVMFSLTMLVWSPAGEAYTLADYRPMLESVGFDRIVKHELQMEPIPLIVAHRK